MNMRKSVFQPETQLQGKNGNATYGEGSELGLEVGSAVDSEASEDDVPGVRMKDEKEIREVGRGRVEVRDGSVEVIVGKCVEWVDRVSISDVRKLEVWRVEVGIEDVFVSEGKGVVSGFRVERRDVSESVRRCEVDCPVVETGRE